MSVSYSELVNLAVEQGSFPRYLYRYRTINDNLINSLQNDYLWFSKLDDFNDPFDGRLVMPQTYTDVEIGNYMEKVGKIPRLETFSIASNAVKNMATFCRFIEDAVQAQKERTKICCFSPVNDNILMWSHYSDSHKGICLEFNVTSDPMVFVVPAKVDYQIEYPKSNYLVDQASTIDHLIKTKAKVWDYEQEIRIIKPNQASNKVPYKKEALSSVIFGCKTPQSDIETIQNILGSKICYKRAILDDNSYKLNILPL